MKRESRNRKSFLWVFAIIVLIVAALSVFSHRVPRAVPSATSPAPASSPAGTPSASHGPEASGSTTLPALKPAPPDSTAPAASAPDRAVLTGTRAFSRFEYAHVWEEGEPERQFQLEKDLGYVVWLEQGLVVEVLDQRKDDNGGTCLSCISWILVKTGDGSQWWVPAGKVSEKLNPPSGPEAVRYEATISESCEPAGVFRNLGVAEEWHKALLTEPAPANEDHLRRLEATRIPLAAGTRVRVTQRQQQGIGQGSWLFVEATDGRKGWIPEVCVKSVATSQSAPAARSLPYETTLTGDAVGVDADYHQAVTFKKGERVHVIGLKDDGWLVFVETDDGRKGWISRLDLGVPRVR